MISCFGRPEIIVGSLRAMQTRRKGTMWKMLENVELVSGCDLKSICEDKDGKMIVTEDVDSNSHQSPVGFPELIFNHHPPTAMI